MYIGLHPSAVESTFNDARRVLRSLPSSATCPVLSLKGLAKEEDVENGVPDRCKTSSIGIIILAMM